MNLCNLLPGYEDYLKYERALAVQTVYAYMSDARALALFLDKAVSSITRDDLRAYMRHLTRQGYHVSTVRRMFHGFGTLWEWLMLEGHAVENHPRACRVPRAERVAPRWLTESELKTFTETAFRRARWRGLELRDSLALRTLAWLGLRRSELLNLKIENVRLEDRLIIVRQTKGKNDRALPIPSPLQPDFEALAYNRQPDEFLFGSGVRRWGKSPFMRMFNAHLEVCGLDGQGITPHTLRHTVGTHMAMRGVPPHVIRDWLGHRDISTTGVYLHANHAAMVDVLKVHPLSRSAKK